MRIWRGLIQAVGAATIALSFWGFYWLVDGFRNELIRPVHTPEAPFFRQAFFAMNAIDTAVLVAMILVATGLLRLRPHAVRVYTWLYVVVIVYVFAVGALWGPGPVGRSIAAASGVGDTGLEPLVFIPLPFIYPVLSVALANLSVRQLKKRANPPGTSADVVAVQ